MISVLHILALCLCIILSRLYMYVLAFKVRELLIMCYVILMFIDLFIDWGNPSRLTPVMILIDLG